MYRCLNEGMVMDIYIDYTQIKRAKVIIYSLA